MLNNRPRKRFGYLMSNEKLDFINELEFDYICKLNSFSHSFVVTDSFIIIVRKTYCLKS